jgi:hypothetical protein
MKAYVGVDAMKVYVGVDVEFYAFLTLALVGGE